MNRSGTKKGLSLALLGTFLLLGGLLVVDQAIAGPLMLRVTGTFLDPSASKEGANIVVFSYRGVEYPFIAEKVTVMDPEVSDARGALRRIGKPNIIVFGNEDAIKAIKEHGTVGNTYTLEGQVYAADRIFQLTSSTFVPKSK